MDVVFHMKKFTFQETEGPIIFSLLQSKRFTNHQLCF